MTEPRPAVAPEPRPRHRAAEPSDRPARNWRKRLIIAAVLLVLLVAAYFALAAAVARWWAQRIGSAVNGHLGTGGFLGVLIGLCCTLVPLIFLWIGLRKHRSWKVVAFWIVLAVIVALPNLFTLGVVLGGGAGAHAGQRTMDVDAPWFRGGTLAGAIVGALVFLCFVFFTLGRHRPWQAGYAEPSDR